MRGRNSNLAATLWGTAAPDFIRATGRHLWQTTSPMTKNVIYASGVIYDAGGSNLAYPGPRGAQRHREIRGPARKSPRSGSISLLEDWVPDLRGGFATACPGHEPERCHL